jgi:hypothetical protein
MKQFRFVLAVALAVAVLAPRPSHAQTDHLKCYKAKDGSKIAALVNLNSPQLGLESGCRVKSASLICVPVSKTVTNLTVNKLDAVPLPVFGSDPGVRICYKVKCPLPFPPDQVATDQFGTRIFGKLKAYMLCMPAVLGADYCGDGVKNGTEQCDGADAASCPGACRADCTCPAVNGTPIPCATSTPVPTVTVVPVPCATSTPVPTVTVSPIPCATSTPVPTVTVVLVPCATSTPIPTVVAPPCGTATPVPTATPVVCGPGEVNCGGTCVILASNSSNCGACGNVCSVPNAGSFCAGGQCQFASCNFGFLDCDNNLNDGCETFVLNDPNNCGGCGNVCSVPNAFPSCSGGTCQVGSCFSGSADCNNNAGDGCETNTSNNTANCGSCGHFCSAPNTSMVCSGGTCQVDSCNFGFDDCDHLPNDGCEQDVLFSDSNCGSCGNQCPGGLFPEHCNFGTCQF